MVGHTQGRVRHRDKLKKWWAHTRNGGTHTRNGGTHTRNGGTQTRKGKT